MTAPAAFRALRHRNYRLFFAGQFFSLVGTWMQSVAQSWLVYRLTGSAVLLGLVGFAGQIPVFLVAPLGGAIADRHRRHRILLTTQSASMVLAFVLAGLTLSGRIAVWEVFVLASSLGLVNAFDIPARQAFVPEMVGREDLGNAIALNSSMFNGARIVGPAIAGVLVAAVGEGWCFLGNAVSYLAVLAGLLAMRLAPSALRPPTTSALASVLEGFAFVARTPPIRALLLMLGMVSLTGMPYAVLMPVFADRVLHGGPGTLGLLMSSSGVGALAGALTLAARRGMKGLSLGLAIAAAGFGASLVLFSFSRAVPLSMLLLVPVGFSMMTAMASSNTLIQSMVPDAMRGRVMAVYSMMFMGMAPFGALVAGAAADRIGAPLTVTVCGVLCMTWAAFFASRLPRLRPEMKAMILARRAEGAAEDALAASLEDVGTGTEAH